jgi:hypothetical protein
MRHWWLLSLLCGVMILWGCDHTILIPPDVTFNNPTPQWSWTGTWQIGDVGTMSFVQNGEDLSGQVDQNNLVVGKVTGNVGTGSIGEHPFTFVMSDDGMYLKGEITGTEMRNLKRIGPPIALTPSEVPPAAAAGPPPAPPPLPPLLAPRPHSRRRPTAGPYSLAMPPIPTVP